MLQLVKPVSVKPGPAVHADGTPVVLHVYAICGNPLAEESERMSCTILLIPVLLSTVLTLL